MKGFIGFLLRDKHRLPPMSLAEIIGIGVGVTVVLFLVFSVIF